jgi:stearoyl-CoA desaturase (delta-9 desaturase)
MTSSIIPERRRPLGAAPTAPDASEGPRSDGRRSAFSPDWINIGFLATAHTLALVALLYLIFVQCSLWTLGLGLLWFAFAGFSITGGYHRLFAHRAYSAHSLLRAFYLFFGAAAVQNSALKWCADHRLHHAKTDTDDDPYNIRRGFLWAHVGWVLSKDPEPSRQRTADLEASRLVRLQDRHFLLWAVLSAAVLPGLLGLLWGDPLGALLVAGFLRLVVQWHATFFVNSLAHCVGHQPYGSRTTARDSFWVALLTLGEGYHNFHHSFPTDYRNGVRFYHFDPTKWLVWSLSRVGLTGGLKRVPHPRLARARLAARDARAA